MLFFEIFFTILIALAVGAGVYYFLRYRKGIK
jgi:hypothetical protein